jgi:addiction module HigA family antidote
MLEEGKTPTPGDILKEEFLDPMGVSAYQLAKGIFVDQTRISQIIKGKRRITADTALRLSRFFGMSETFWLNLQSTYDVLETKSRDNEILGKIKPHKAS